MDYTVIGDTVNTASRLESYGRNLDVAQTGGPYRTIVISEATRSLLGSDFELRSVGALELKGKAETIEAYEVVTVSPTSTEA